MSLQQVPAGRNFPDDINVIIEVPMNSPAIKYEVDKASGAIFVDRMLKTAMYYPCNYGYVPHTLCGDGDPVDVLVVLPLPMLPGTVVRCRPVGVLLMKDEAGDDAKIIAVPVTDVTGISRDIKSVEDLDEILLDDDVATAVADLFVAPATIAGSLLRAHIGDRTVARPGGVSGVLPLPRPAIPYRELPAHP